ncbi:uncharacterized protein LOC115982924 isoform X1 [Quercus lobata]|uniref:uncharacterized protein LOC115982924 isoform X1 n=1 Tax=Quercus lobata TaxID=97700 RepID=UPI001245C32C|nr:uncharacterized protein LOC115982924 isoform X1 [Quercus lobata]XP_030961543.1 uncharacterized protein LOC115982924 isoform X1 [Quercus lobata]XP_030961545.1 uncharacterized protein LOC115982924 isoform X1 [Quercus lobata]XP_030961546.1 uncharacterized protein LOC115982924 isoform X1 [Quercus lobata]XP_030961547.1 uncharacterized protein LOC115982924 isoform X1 [Quercus lobata]XP_030961548.1 uncharacterized protein LOC115982924 isoform X1 [Quercus lobata]
MASTPVEVQKVLHMMFAFYCKSRGILRDSSYHGKKKFLIYGTSSGVHNSSWKPSQKHLYTVNINAAVQRYRANLGKKLGGTGFVVRDQDYYPICCGSSWTINDNEEVLDLDVKAAYRWGKLIIDRYKLNDFNIQMDSNYIPAKLSRNKKYKETKVDQTLKMIRSKMLEGKGCNIEFEWISSHINTVADSFAKLGCDIHFAKENGGDLTRVLPSHEFYDLTDYPKWSGDDEYGFSEFFDESTYVTWDGETGYPAGFKEVLFNSFRNKIIIPTDTSGDATTITFPEFNIVDPIGKQILEKIDVLASLISNKEISRLIIQFWCKDEDNPREEVLVDVNHLHKEKEKNPVNDLYKLLESFQIQKEKTTAMPFTEGVLKLYAQYTKSTNKINSDIKHSVLNPIVEFHRRWKYFGSVAYQITITTQLPESEDDLHRFEAYKEKLHDLPIVGDQDSRYVTHISTIDHGELVGEYDTNDSSELEEGCNMNYGTVAEENLSEL